jgi:hypothetical protein
MGIEEFDNVIREIENKLNTHPNLARLWIEYLNVKKYRLETAINEAKNIVQTLETNQDISMNNILLLISCHETMRENKI